MTYRWVYIPSCACKYLARWTSPYVNKKIYAQHIILHVYTYTNLRVCIPIMASKYFPHITYLDQKQLNEEPKNQWKHIKG